MLSKIRCATVRTSSAFSVSPARRTAAPQPRHSRAPAAQCIAGHYPLAPACSPVSPHTVFGSDNLDCEQSLVLQHGMARFEQPKKRFSALGIR